ncbi:uncharacterized protein LOC135805790 isoform X2 [Sycon ciliatum]|uniref:uncharacterized protein LOC135805790 isoform X2 n=1 Tax=Sycon ciliatum TaxID=27933 RepID=UPI0031F6C44C
MCGSWSQRVVYMNRADAAHDFEYQGPSGMPDCMTDLMRKAVLPTNFVERYVEIFRQQGIDEALLSDLPFTDMQTLFVNIGISRAGDRIKLFRCFNPVTQQNSMCSRKQCENGGLCRYNVDTKHFTCSCPGDFWPPFCKTKKVRDMAVVVRELSEDVHKLKSIISKIGTTYNRWGSTACPAGSELTYVGFMAGSYYSHAGGGANYLCLPFQPLYDRFNSGVQKLGQIAGTEYEFTSNSGQSTSPLQDRNVPCSVCYATGRTTTLMVPARNDCPPKWVVEYTGYLMTAHHSSGNNHRSEYVCVDDHFETLPGYHGNTDGAHLWPVEAGCGIGLDCPPYHAEKELTCAVCTRQ